MRNVVVVAAVAIAAVAAAPLALGKGDVRGTCANANGLDVYFWPRGHEAVPELGFGPFAVPHFEFYRARDVSNATGYLGSGSLSQISVSSACSSTADRAMAPVPAGSPSTTDTQKIRCSFAGGVDVRVAPLTQTTTRMVTKTITVRVKGKRVRKKVRRPVRVSRRIGTQASAAATGSADTLVRVEIKEGAGSRITWDARSCAAVPLTS